MDGERRALRLIEAELQERLRIRGLASTDDRVDVRVYYIGDERFFCTSGTNFVLQQSALTDEFIKNSLVHEIFFYCFGARPTV